MEKKSTGISKWGLVALVVSSSIGSGVFGITSDLASSAAPGPAILSWIIVGIGILALVLSLNHLGEKRPDLDFICKYFYLGSDFISKQWS